MKAAQNILLLVLSATSLFGAFTANRAQHRYLKAEQALDALTLEQMNDSARAAKTVTVLRDSLRFATRPVVQAKVDTAAVIAKLGLSVAPVDTTLESDSLTFVPDSTWYPVYRFHVAQRPFFGEIEVRPIDHTTAGMHIQLGVEPAQLGVRIRCGAAQTRGLRPAEIQVVGPAWLQTEVVGVQQDPMVCNAPVLMTRGAKRRFPEWAVPVLTAVSGALIDREKPLRGSAVGGIFGALLLYTVRF